MTASPDPKPRASFSRGSSQISFEPIEDERDFDSFGSVIPDSQTAPNTLLNQLHLRRFSVPREEVSTSTMAEGFCFAEKKPPRPGQFSERPKPEQPQAADTSQFFPRPKNIPAEHSPLSPLHAPVHIHRPAIPLDLPELGLTGCKVLSEISSHVNEENLTGRSDNSSSHTIVPLEKSSTRDSPGEASVICIDSSRLPHENTSEASDINAPPPTETGSIFDAFRFGKEATKAQVSQRLGKQVNISLPHIKGHGRQLEGLKLPLPHVTRVDRASHQAPSSSTCGDLEAPVPRTPVTTTKSRNRVSRGHWPTQPPSASKYHRVSDRNNDRPASRSSNISRKRSAKQRVYHRPTFEPDRKKIAMQNVAEYWNECIQIAEAERQEAFQEITLLEDKLRHTQKALDKSVQLIAEKDSAIGDSKCRLGKLQEEGSLAEKETQRLQGEIESLRSDLIKSRDLEAATHEKYRKHRSKLNEAIKEQQVLFSRARNLHKEANDELQKERDRREKEAKAVELALEDSHRKREELKSCIEKYRSESEQEAQKQKHTISELQLRLENQEKEINREREAATELQNRLKTESSLLDEVKTFRSDMSSLREGNEKYTEWSEKQGRLTNTLLEKLELMSNHLESRSDGQMTKEEVKVMADKLETNIVSRLMSEIQKIISSQSDAKESAGSLQDIIQEHFEKLHNNIVDQQETLSKCQQWHEKAHQALVEHLGDISAKTLATQKTCDETNKSLARLATGHSVWQEGFQTHLDNKLTKQLQDRESKIGDLEETLHQISQEWSKKLDLMKTSMLESDEQAREYLQATICEIKTRLTTKLEEERVASEKDISKSETMQAAVEAHLQQVKIQLEGMSSSGPESQLLRETLAEERKKTHDLQQQLAALECDSGVNAELFQRQLQDLKAIDVLKNQLEGMTEQVPRVENLNTTFNKMVDLNQVMQSTAFYLSKERHWVNEKLGVIPQAVGSRGETGTQSVYFNEHGSEESNSCGQEKSTDTKGSASLSDLTTLDLHYQGERYRRKVVVASPALEASSPAPAPSVIQEQARRREGSAPRSILRLSTASTQETETIRPPANHSQYNRPVMAKVNSAIDCSNPEMVEQIRSGLIQSKPARPNWDFPTMEDFAKEILPNGKDDGGIGKKHSISFVGEEDDIASPNKRVKSEEAPADSQPESSDRPLLLRTRHVIRKTYSKQSN
ncbi:uncharacterized protein FFMR_09533 [Fusarium fujikuroi]|nr:uncharacterized protein FFE2_05058 [Fusarium fujikuroi]SCN84531.1 uncharacterized protein FFC1_04585 [Fusarium fujikuroi]SCO49066.1 uncharacterized protein FFMR_09533 [Fusarium fujikuroi]